METGRNGAPCLDANQTARRKGRSRPSKGVRVRARRKAFRFVSAFILHRVLARRIYIHGCCFRMEPEAVHVNENGTSAVGIAVTVKAPPARKARGVVSSDNARFGKPGLAVDVSAVHSASEPPRARPPKQATVNSRAHVSVWIQAARTALGLERPAPSRLMHDSCRSRDERVRIIVRSFYPASRWTSHPE